MSIPGLPPEVWYKYVFIHCDNVDLLSVERTCKDLNALTEEGWKAAFNTRFKLLPIEGHEGKTQYKVLHLILSKRKQLLATRASLITSLLAPSMTIYTNSCNCYIRFSRIQDKLTNFPKCNLLADIKQADEDKLESDVTFLVSHPDLPAELKPEFEKIKTEMPQIKAGIIHHRQIEESSKKILGISHVDITSPTQDSELGRIDREIDNLPETVAAACQFDPELATSLFTQHYQLSQFVFRFTASGTLGSLSNSDNT